MRCAVVQRQMVACLDQELSRRRQRRVQEHLARCGQCRPLEQQMATLTTLLHQQPEPPVPHGFAARIVEQISQDAHPQPQRLGLADAPPRLSSQPARWSLPWWLPLPAVVQTAAMLLVTLAGIHVGSATHAAMLGAPRHRIMPVSEFHDIAHASVEGVYLDLLTTVAVEEPGDPP